MDFVAGAATGSLIVYFAGGSFAAVVGAIAGATLYQMAKMILVWPHYRKH